MYPLLDIILYQHSLTSLLLGSIVVVLLMVATYQTVMHMEKHRTMQNKILQELQARIRTRRSVLDDNLAIVFRYDGEFLEIPSEIARKRGLPARMPGNQFASYMHPDSLSVYQQIASNKNVNGIYSFKMKLRFPNDTDYQWYRMKYSVDMSREGIQIEGITTCIEDEMKQLEKERNIHNQMAEETQVFEHLIKDINTLRPIGTKFRTKAEQFLELDPHTDKQQMKGLSMQLEAIANTLKSMCDSTRENVSGGK